MYLCMHVCVYVSTSILAVSSNIQLYWPLLLVSPSSTCLRQIQHHFLCGLIKNVTKHEFIRKYMCVLQLKIAVFKYCKSFENVFIPITAAHPV